MIPTWLKTSANATSSHISGIQNMHLKLFPYEMKYWTGNKTQREKQKETNGSHDFDTQLHIPYLP